MIRLSSLFRLSSKQLPIIPMVPSYPSLNINTTFPTTKNLAMNTKFYFSIDPRDNRPEKEDRMYNLRPGQGKHFDGEGEELKDPMKMEEENEKEDEASFQNENKRSIYFFIVAALGLIGGYVILQMNTMREEKRSTKSAKVTYTGKADIGGPWKLIDMQGNTVTDQDFKGAYYLLYFGFCNCPDICPISLQKISKALALIRKMPESKYIKLKTVFVSVDPDRDTPERMQKFLKHFDSSIIGLTGRSNDDSDLRNMMNKYRIYASKIEMDEKPLKPGEKRPYTLDHTIITYLMDDQNNYLTHLGSNLSDRDLAQIIIDAALVREREKARGIRD